MYPTTSADSHITEPPDTYVDRIDPAWRDKAPRLVDGGEGVGDVFVIGAVFERHPDLKVVCVEAGAGWVPRFMYRIDTTALAAPT